MLKIMNLVLLLLSRSFFGYFSCNFWVFYDVMFLFVLMLKLQIQGHVHLNKRSWNKKATYLQFHPPKKICKAQCICFIDINQNWFIRIYWQENNSAINYNRKRLHKSENGKVYKGQKSRNCGPQSLTSITLCNLDQSK